MFSKIVFGKLHRSIGFMEARESGEVRKLRSIEAMDQSQAGYLDMPKMA